MYNKIKKQNGEHFANALRNFDIAIFDIPNIDQIVKYAGDNAEPIMAYLQTLGNNMNKDKVVLNPIELLAQAGYKAYYADTLQKLNHISRYFAPGEGFCTFKEMKRYQDYYIINAIKDNVDEIKREQFKHPHHEDEYAKSVLSIQIPKKGGNVAIRNRYNNAVENPDNTFNSNPDYIIPGLSEAIKNTFDVDFFSPQVSVPNHYMICGNQIVNFNYEVDNIYFGENFYVKNGQIHELDPQKELMLDYVVLNRQNKTINNPSGVMDGFIEALSNEIKGKKIQIVVNAAKNKCLLADGVQILELMKGKIVSLNLPKTATVKDNFLYFNTGLKHIRLENVKKIGHNFLHHNTELEELNLPKAENLGYGCLYNNSKLQKLSAPKVQEVASCVLFQNRRLKELYLPEVLTIENGFLSSNTHLPSFKAPKLQRIGHGFLENNFLIQELDLPSLVTIGNGFLSRNVNLQKFSAEKLEKIGNKFLCSNKELKELTLNQVRNIGDNFLAENFSLCTFIAPRLTEIGDNFLQYNSVLCKFVAPRLTEIGDKFLYENQKLAELNLPDAVAMGKFCLRKNTSLQRLYLPKIKNFNDSFLEQHLKRSELWASRYNINPLSTQIDYWEERNKKESCR